ncbi:MAG: hypothetical protein ACN6I7_04075 [bacterium]
MMAARQVEETGQFELQEAFDLINKTVLAKGTWAFGQQTVQSIGIVVGVLALNDEVEVVVKFMDRVVQMNKREFTEEIEALADDDGLLIWRRTRSRRCSRLAAVSIRSGCAPGKPSTQLFASPTDPTATPPEWEGALSFPR